MGLQPVNHAAGNPADGPFTDADFENQLSDCASYRIEEVLRLPRNNVDCAIVAVLRTQPRPETEFVAKINMAPAGSPWRREVRLSQELVHENILPHQGMTVFSIRGARRPAYLMPRAKTLLEYVRNTPVSINRAGFENLFIGVLSALRYCHHRGVVHSDVNASNIFLRSRQTQANAAVRLDECIVMLGDFGSATVGLRRDFIPQGTPRWVRVTNTNQPRTQFDDIWSLVLCAYRLLVSPRLDPMPQEPTNDVNLLMPAWYDIPAEIRSPDGTRTLEEGLLAMHPREEERRNFWLGLFREVLLQRHVHPDRIVTAEDIFPRLFGADLEPLKEQERALAQILRDAFRKRRALIREYRAAFERLNGFQDTLNRIAELKADKQVATRSAERMTGTVSLLRISVVARTMRHACAMRELRTQLAKREASLSDLQARLTETLDLWHEREPRLWALFKSLRARDAALRTTHAAAIEAFQTSIDAGALREHALAARAQRLSIRLRRLRRRQARARNTLALSAAAHANELTALTTRCDNIQKADELSRALVVRWQRAFAAACIVAAVLGAYLAFRH